MQVTTQTRLVYTGIHVHVYMSVLVSYKICNFCWSITCVCEECIIGTLSLYHCNTFLPFNITAAVWKYIEVYKHDVTVAMGLLCGLYDRWSFKILL